MRMNWRWHSDCMKKQHNKQSYDIDGKRSLFKDHEGLGLGWKWGQSTPHIGQHLQMQHGLLFRSIFPSFLALNLFWGYMVQPKWKVSTNLFSKPRYVSWHCGPYWWKAYSQKAQRNQWSTSQTMAPLYAKFQETMQAVGFEKMWDSDGEITLVLAEYDPLAKMPEGAVSSAISCM